MGRSKKKIARTLLTCGFWLLVMACDNSKPAGENGTQVQEEKTPATKNRTIVFFGDSLTAGYGLDEPSLAFPGLIQRRLDSASMPYHVVNAGVSGETSSGGLERIDWILNNPLDVFVLELGANDGLRGIPPETTRKNLQSIIDKVRTKYPESRIILAGMQVPPNMGQRYTSQFRSIFPDLARQNDIPLIPFLLEGVGGEATLNQPDGIHPNIEGHAIVAENVWPVLYETLKP